MSKFIPPEDAPQGYLTEERHLIQQMARDFTMKEVLPVANELDPKEGEIPMSLRDQMAEMGYFGITVPEEYGGMGLGSFEYCLITEELARGWMSVASIIARGNGVFGARTMTEEQRRKYLPRSCRGEFLAAASLSEPDTGSDLSSISCRARREGDEYIVNGNKYWCTFADGADYIMLFARTSEPPDQARRHIGISGFIIEKERGSLPPGVSGAPIPKIGYFGWKTWELSFDDCRIPADCLVGEEGKAFYIMASGLEVARAHTAARAIGLARGGLEDAMAYAHERQQFGRPISEFQAIRFKIADMAAEIEAARQLLYFVCTEIDQGRRCDKEASMVKLFASEMAERVTSEAIQIFGGAGYTKLHAVERYWRDARLTKIFEGTSEIQRRIISDNLLGKPDNQFGN
ncbi:MAG: acyl-CoA dehydrogenase family protein [Alphaproteobacteria bacterium]|jgi:alkylation response protein AidB-like acyl-CoA dehydrogenase|nr:acyl-CoA dehydrogenase family protein [Alphaproteobacteria bacterium]MDP6566538.1 acyl-CoA dehydrogenase family protein [Alphaproteobacteria bacterium]MDP6815954.1 acyl-CoA dehydrogenase family protein [Alphaproteobacteria bacterium]